MNRGSHTRVLARQLQVGLQQVGRANGVGDGGGDLRKGHRKRCWRFRLRDFLRLFQERLQRIVVCRGGFRRVGGDVLEGLVVQPLIQRKLDGADLSDHLHRLRLALLVLLLSQRLAVVGACNGPGESEG